MILIILDFLRKLVIEDQKARKNANKASGKQKCKLWERNRNKIKLCQFFINEISKWNILQNVKFSCDEDREVATEYFENSYVEYQDKLTKNGVKEEAIVGQWKDAYLSVYPTPYDEIHEEDDESFDALSEDEKDKWEKELNKKVDNCKRRIYEPIERSEDDIIHNILESIK